MATKLNLTDTQKEELIEVYRDKIKKLDQQKREYIDLINQLNGDQIKPAKNQLSLPTVSMAPLSYDPNWSWSLKARYILTSTGMCLTVREIFDKIIVYEPTLGDEYRENYQYLSSTISTKISSKKMFDRFKSPEKTGYLIGLKEWFDKNGDLKPGIKSSSTNIENQSFGDIIQSVLR